MEPIKSSELITNEDGSVFHLHLHPEDLADQIILVGDPSRVEMIASYFDNIEIRKSDREFHTITGQYKGKRLSVISTGIGPDNIDIVMNELDALVNIDLQTKEIKTEKKHLNIVRIGTSGSVQADVPVHSFVISEMSLGIDGVLRFYRDNERVCDTDFEDAFIKECHWTPLAARPYAVKASTELVNNLHTEGVTVKGVTLTANGFYGPQGRVLRLPIEMPAVNDEIARFSFNGHKIVNYEMESAAIAGLSALMGHHATTICLIIANRANGDASSNYKPYMKELVEYTLDSLVR